MSRTAWAWARLLGGSLILAVLAWRLGSGPFLDGLRAVGPVSVLLAVLITAATTVCSAWRWRVVARELGVGLPMSRAVAAYYRSQFLNTALPGGVLGDVHRGVDHGRTRAISGAGCAQWPGSGSPARWCSSPSRRAAGRAALAGA